MLKISNDGIVWSASSASFTYRALATASSISPAEGPVSGGVDVTVTGANFLDTQQTFCSFDGVWFEVKTFTSTSEVVCQAPAALVAGNVNVLVGNLHDPGRWHSTAQTFSYYGEWQRASTGLAVPTVACHHPAWPTLARLC